MTGQLDTMGAWVWPLTAPWESARFVDCGGALPEDLVEAGLSVQLFHQGRFSHLRPPVVAGSVRSTSRHLVSLLG